MAKDAKPKMGLTESVTVEGEEEKTPLLSVQAGNSGATATVTSETVSPAATTPEPFEAIRVKPPPIERVNPEAATVERYWLGTKANCPHYNVNIAGACFPHMTGYPGGDGNPGNQRWGGFQFLSKSQLANLMKRVSETVFRMSAPLKDRLDVTDVTYSYEPGDEPIARYLYMVKAPKDKPIDMTRPDLVPAMLAE